VLLLEISPVHLLLQFGSKLRQGSTKKEERMGKRFSLFFLQMFFDMTEFEIGCLDVSFGNQLAGLAYVFCGAALQVLRVYAFFAFCFSAHISFAF